MEGVDISNKFADVLRGIGIDALNAMQVASVGVIESGGDVKVLAPTGTGKTLAYLLPLLSVMQDPGEGVQVLVAVPTRELAMQVGEVARRLGVRYFVSVGGHPFEAEQRSLRTAVPRLLVATPGRLVEHLEQQDVDLGTTQVVVLDEWDKTLEMGFTKEMEFIMESLTNVRQRVLMSATAAVEIPDFVGVRNLQEVDFLSSAAEVRLELQEYYSAQKDKLPALVELLTSVGPVRSIVFCNYRDSAERIFNYIDRNGGSCVCYHGGMDQTQREKSLALFAGGSALTLVATDIAARGLDIPEVDCIVHYHLPAEQESFVHRNGRTARMKAQGRAFVILSDDDPRPGYLPTMYRSQLKVVSGPMPRAPFTTIYIGKGRRDKISRGDVVGFVLQVGSLDSGKLGRVEVKDRYSMAAVPAECAQDLISALSGQKIKGQKTICEVIKAPSLLKPEVDQNRRRFLKK